MEFARKANSDHLEQLEQQVALLKTRSDEATQTLKEALSAGKPTDAGVINGVGSGQESSDKSAIGNDKKQLMIDAAIANKAVRKATRALAEALEDNKLHLQQSLNELQLKASELNQQLAQLKEQD